MEELPTLRVLPNGVLIPTEEFLIAIHDRIIDYRKEFGREDTRALRDRGVLQHLCDMLADRPHKYSNDAVRDTLYVATETFYNIACQHPFHDGNKSTAYVSALVLIYANSYANAINGKELHFGLYEDKWLLGAPKEAETITRLAEAGQDDKELKRLIKEFLQKSV
jgi:prophage maintenance system killer protein